jgi:hypothetical protein
MRFSGSKEFGKFFVDVNPHAEVIILAPGGHYAQGTEYDEQRQLLKESCEAGICDEYGHTHYMSFKGGDLGLVVESCLNVTDAQDRIDYLAALEYAAKSMREMLSGQ